MSKYEIKNLLLNFIVECDPMNWSNEKVYYKFTEIFYQKFADLEAKLAEKDKIIQMQQNIKRFDIGEMLTENIKSRKYSELKIQKSQ